MGYIYIPLDMGWCEFRPPMGEWDGVWHWVYHIIDRWKHASIFIRGSHKNDPFLMHFRKSICRFQGLNCLLQGGTGLVYQGNFSYAFLVNSKAFWNWCIQKRLYIFKCIIDVVGIYIYRVHTRQSLHIRHLDFWVGRCCPMGVFDVEDVPQGKRAVVVNERNCTTCRECLETFNGQALSERDSGFA